jgi:hypothetical protein
MKRILLTLIGVFFFILMYAQLPGKDHLLYLNFDNQVDLAQNSQGMTADTATAFYDQSGKFGGCASFEGYEFIIMDAYDTLKCDTSFTWVFWFKTSEDAGSLVQWGHFSGTPALENGPAEPEEGGLDPHWPGDVTLFMGWIPGAISYDVGYVGMAECGGDTPVEVNDGQWHHFAMSCEVGEVTTESFYIDGELKSTAEVGPGFIDEDGAVYQIKIGYSTSAWPCDQDGVTQYPYYTGKMDEFRIYGTALDANDILTLFAYEPLAIEEFDADQVFSVFPNPSSDYITIRSKHVRDIEIFNSKGQSVLIKKDVPIGSVIDVKDFDNGLYFLKSGDYTQKLIIK